MSCVLEAPCDQVFAAWTDPRHLARWWGPKGLETKTDSIDVRAGGAWLYSVTGPDGAEYPNRIHYRKVEASKRLQYLHDSGEDDDPSQFQVTVQFEGRGERTKLSMTLLFLSADECARAKAFAVEGGRQTIARLDAYVTGGAATSNSLR